jgi:protein phosphatase
MVSTADASTPAARASALTRPRDAAPTSDDSERGVRRRRHPVRTSVILVLLAAILGVGVWGGWLYTQSKYYVGVTDDGKIAVFQGIPSQIAGFQLSTVVYRTDVSIDSLTPASQEAVRSTILKDSRSEAMAALNGLLDPNARNVIPTCVTITIRPTPSPTASSSPSVDPSASAVDPGGSASASPTAAPSPSVLVTTSPSPCRSSTR